MSALKFAIPTTSNPDLNFRVQKWVIDQGLSTTVDDVALQDNIAQWGLPWFRAGALVVNENGKILMMHEGRVQVKKIKDAALRQKLLAKGCKPSAWVDGDGGWNIPAGRLSLGESFEDAAIREVQEESGWKIVVQRYLYVRLSEELGNQFIMPVFMAKPISGPAEFHTTATRETLEIAWMTVEEIRALHTSDMLRSPTSVLSSLDAYQKFI